MHLTFSLRSLLFVPGTRLDRLPRALACGADLVCIDLEDSVPLDRKAECRSQVAALEPAGGRLAVRINGLTTRAGLEDLLALAPLAERLDALFVPMVRSAAEMEVAAGSLPASLPLIPLIEDPAGLDQAAAIAAHDRVGAVMFGGGDMAAAIGVALEWEPLLFARSRLVMATAQAGKPAIDVPFIGLGDTDGLAREAAQARRLGFAAKAAIHPDQIADIHAAFGPRPEEIEEAKAAEAAFAAAGGAAVRFRGRMLEEPIMRKYRQILARGE